MGAYENPQHPGIVDPMAFVNAFNRSYGMFASLAQQSAMRKDAKEAKLIKAKEDHEKKYGKAGQSMKQGIMGYKNFSTTMTSDSILSVSAFEEYAKEMGLTTQQIDNSTSDLQGHLNLLNTLAKAYNQKDLNIDNIDMSKEGASEILGVWRSMDNGAIPRLSFNAESGKFETSFEHKNGTDIDLEVLNGHINLFSKHKEFQKDNNESVYNNGINAAITQANLFSKDTKENVNVKDTTDHNVVINANKDILARFRKGLGDHLNLDDIGSIWHNDKKFIDISDKFTAGYGSFVPKVSGEDETSKLLPEDLPLTAFINGERKNGLTKEFATALNTMEWGDMQESLNNRIDLSHQVGDVGVDVSEGGYDKKDIDLAENIIEIQRNRVIDHMFNQWKGDVDKISLLQSKAIGETYKWRSEDKRALSIIDTIQKQLGKINEKLTTGGWNDPEALGDVYSTKEKTDLLASLLTTISGKSIITKDNTWAIQKQALEGFNDDLDMATGSADGGPVLDENDKVTTNIKYHPQYRATDAAAKARWERTQHASWTLYEEIGKGDDKKLRPILDDISTAESIYDFARAHRNDLYTMLKFGQLAEYNKSAPPIDLQSKVDEYIN